MQWAIIGDDGGTGKGRAREVWSKTRAELWAAAVRLRVWWKSNVCVLWRRKMSPEDWQGLEAGRLGVVPVAQVGRAGIQ